MKKKKHFQRANPSLQYARYPSGQPGGGMMYVPPGQKQSTLGQTFYGSQAGIPVGTEALFSPGVPLPNLPNVNPGGYPIQQRFPVAYNTFPVDRTLGDQDIPSFQQLRALARLYNGITLCERAWFDMVPRMQLKIGIKPEYVAAGAQEKDYQTEITYFLNWFETPDKMHDLHSWIRMALREQTQIDELYIYKRKTRSGKLYSLEIHSGDQFKPLLDDWGRIPEPPSYGIQQYPWGLPGAWFRTDEMIHYQESPAADTPYGQSRIERIIMLVNQAIRKQKKDLAHFTEGNIPQGYMMVPESAIWTPDQIDTFEQAWNALLAGSPVQQTRIRFTQPGMEYKAFEQYALDPTFDKFILNIAVSSYGMSMQDVAFTEDIHKSSGDSQQNVTYRRTIDPLATIYAMFLTDVMNHDFPEEFQGHMFKATFGGYDEEEDISELSAAYKDLVSSGILGVTAAGKLLKLPDDPNAPYIGRVVMSKDGPIFLDDVATEKMRSAQVQATLAGYQAASSSPQQQTIPNANNLKSSQQHAPQSGQSHQQQQAQTKPVAADSATESVAGSALHANALQSIKTQLQNRLAEQSTPEDNQFTDYLSEEDLDNLEGMQKSPETLENEEDIEALGGDNERIGLDDEDDEDEDEDAVMTPEEQQQENEIKLLLDADKDEPFSELERSVFYEIRRHHPGGHDHDQKTHGDWAHPSYAQGHAKSTTTASSATANATKSAAASGIQSSGLNGKITKAAASVQTAAADVLKARQNLENASAADKQSARQAVAQARQELHDARLALHLYREQARQAEQAAQKEAKVEAEKQRQAAAEKQKVKAKLEAQKQKLHIQKVAAAAKAKAAKIAVKAQLKAQVAASKAASKAAKPVHVAALKTAITHTTAAKQLLSLANTLGSKSILYNALASRQINSKWTAQDAEEAHQISQDLKQLAEMITNHQNEADVVGLVNNLNIALSELQGTHIPGRKISAGAGKIGATTGPKSSRTGISSGRVSVLEKLLAKSQAEITRVEESAFDEERRYTIDEVIQLFQEQMQNEEAGEEDEENTLGSKEERMAETTNSRAHADYKRWRQRALDDIKYERSFRGFTTVEIPEFIHTWISQALYTCTTTEDVKDVFLRAKNIEETVCIFFDIDGVFSIPNAGLQEIDIDNKEAWPIPHANTFLTSISALPLVTPVWLTHWGTKANAWNDRAEATSWDIAFPLSKQEHDLAKQRFPQYNRKLLSIEWYLSKHPYEFVVWMQDGFSPEETLWAEVKGIRLLDTTQEPLHSLLINSDNSAIAAIIENFFLREVAV